MRHDGELKMIDGKHALRFARRYRHPIERVWRAISDPAEMKAWFPSNVEGDRAVGAELAFVDEDQRAAARGAGEPTRAEGPMLRGRVVAHDPPNVFAFTWGTELLRFELTADGDGTTLVFTQILSHQSVAARSASGWHACLSALDAQLGVEVSSEDWRAVYDDYVTRLSPSLGTVDADGSVTWERATHVDPERVRAATSDPSELAAWGAAGDAGDQLRWHVERGGDGTTLYRLTHTGIAGDAELAARWHALLVQFDMYLAAGEYVPVDHGRWVADYAELLGAQRPATR